MYYVRYHGQARRIDGCEQAHSFRDRGSDHGCPSSAFQRVHETGNEALTDLGMGGMCKCRDGVPLFYVSRDLV
jgi:hypothetical protein